MPARSPSSSGIRNGGLYHRETDTEVNAKARAAWRAGLMAIVCVGETKDERVGGKTLDVVHVQTQARCRTARPPANLVVAYEPVWAIGTGLTPTPADVAAVHGFIRRASRDALRRGRAGRSGFCTAARSSPRTPPS